LTGPAPPDRVVSRGADDDPAPAGRYVVRLMKDDGYGELARSSFTVTRR